MDIDGNIARPNMGEEPPLRRCRCGREWRHVWHAPLGGRYPPRWCSPRVDPCELCAEEEDEEAVIRRRLRDAHVPEALWRYSLATGRVRVQAGESDAAFAAGVRAADPPVLGVYRTNADPLRLVARFLATATPIRWLLLLGPAGTGKTTWAAALARRLLTAGPDRWTTDDRPVGDRDLRPDRSPPLPGERTLHRRPTAAVEYHRIDELVEREHAKYRGLDPHPTRDIAEVDVLLLDEIGLTDRPSETERRLVERVVCHRYDRGMPTVVISNQRREDLVGTDGLYGARVGDRLRAAPWATLGGPSWR